MLDQYYFHILIKTIIEYKNYYIYRLKISKFTLKYLI